MSIGHTLTKIKNLKIDVPSNGVVVKIALCDLDLLFEDKELSNFYVS